MGQNVREESPRPSSCLASGLSFKPPTVTRRVKSGLPLVAVISGGQDGADQAGLRAARKLGLATGGWAPRGWKTLDGAAPWLGEEFGLVESGWDYAGRTSANVRDADATVRFARDFCSTGERCTLKAIEKWGKPHFDLHLQHVISNLWMFVQKDEETLVDFLIQNSVRVLNVAGNSEKTAPRIGAIVEKFLLQALGA